MVDPIPADFPRVSPYLLYNDVDAALDFLIEVFGFTERLRLPGPDGKTVHGEAAMGSGVVMLGSPGPDYRNPKARGGATQLVYVFVENVDEHYEAAKAKGATILREPADQYYGDRTYGAEDPEGHHWSFGQHVRDMDPADIRP